MNERISTYEPNNSDAISGSLIVESDIQYISPAEQDAEDMPQHRFELKDGNKIVGGAEIDYYSKPLPFYQLTDLWVEHEYADRGNASRIMTQVEAFLKERRKPGVLMEAILDGPAQGMYERRGWTPVPGSPGRYVYNWPEQVQLDILKGYEMRQTPIDEREGWNEATEENSREMDVVSYSEDEESK
jgi:ribosomal protein S18 acetylase RimI-like enzyme